MYPNYPRLIKHEWRKLLVITLIVFLAAVVLTIVQPFEYRATTSILVMQKSSFSIDAYSASKSEERIAQKLGQVVYSSSFMEQVLNSSYNIDRAYFPTDELKRRKKWDKTIVTGAPAGLSKLDISIYHTDPNQAMLISAAVSRVLTVQKNDYLGIGDVDLRVLDAPLVSKYPVRPNIILNVLLGIIVGLILGVAYVIVTHSPKFHFPHSDNALNSSDKLSPELPADLTEEVDDDGFGGQL